MLSFPQQKTERQAERRKIKCATAYFASTIFWDQHDYTQLWNCSFSLFTFLTTLSSEAHFAGADMRSVAGQTVASAPTGVGETGVTS